MSTQLAEQTAEPLGIDHQPRSAHSVQSDTVEMSSEGWGWLPALSLVGAVGLLGIALAYDAAWKNIPLGAVLQWIGLLVIFVPIAIRLFSPQATRRERIGLVLVLGLLLYLVRVFYSPLEFKFSDELQHWRTADDILVSQHLFSPNPILPISPSYSGLENVTTALVNLTGLTIFEAGILVIGVARLVLIAALYLFYERASQSAYVAGLASLLYMTNPHFQSLAAMFIYQSLALPLAALVLYIEERGEFAHGRSRVGWKLILVLGLAAVVATHHITSYALAAFLTLWTIVALWRKRSHKEQPVPGWTALIAVAMILIWIAYVATETVGYLAPTWTKTVGEIVRLITLEARAGEAFRAPDSPIQEQLLSYMSVGLISLGILVGIRQTWRRYRTNVLALTLAIGSLGYLAGIGLRLVSSAGAELTGRSWSFTFVAVGFVLAIDVAELWKARQRTWMTRLLFPALSIILFAAGITSGWPPYWGRLPGPYLVSASERSIEPQGVAAAQWARVVLGPNNRVTADLTNYLLMGSYGKQDSSYGLSAVYFSPQIGETEQKLLQYEEIRYLVVDKRLSSGLPVRGYYFNQREPNANAYIRPIDTGALSKFDYVEQVDRIFDSGDIIIYDVRVLSGTP